ncbi:MAG: hypothetical protein U0670_01010 [Anaerolineae bacterium]
MIARSERFKKPILLHLFDDALPHPPDAVYTQAGGSYTVFTPFKRRWLELPKPRIQNGSIEGRRFHTLDGLEQPGVPTLAYLGIPGRPVDLPPAGEQVAHDRLRRFIQTDLFSYGERRDLVVPNPFDEPASPGTSYLSPYFRFGMLSPRQAYHAANEARADAPNEAEQRRSIHGSAN